MARVRIRFDEVSTLPPICICCGAPATRIRRQEFQINAALSAAVLVAAAALATLVWTKRGVTLSLPVCEYHKRRGRRSNQTFFRGMALTIGFGIAAYIAVQFDGAVANYLSVAAMLAFIVTIVAAMSEMDDGLKVKTLSGGSFNLSGVHRKFAEAVGMSSAGATDWSTGSCVEALVDVPRRGSLFTSCSTRRPLRSAAGSSVSGPDSS